MGTLRKILATSAKKANLGAKGKPGRRAYPLRKIVDSDGEHEILECGHKGPSHRVVGTDLFSTYQPANSRRCRQCFENNKVNTININL
jgi:hypothetical protein